MSRISAYILLLIYALSISGNYSAQISLMLNYEQVLEEYCIYNDILLEKCNGRCYEKHLQASQQKQQPDNHSKLPGKNIPHTSHLKSCDTRINCIAPVSLISFSPSIDALSERHRSEIFAPPETGII